MRINISYVVCADYWQPEDVPIEEASDSSDNSSSIITNFSIEKVQSLQKDETSDSSEDEYIPFGKYLPTELAQYAFAFNIKLV